MTILHDRSLLRPDRPPRSRTRPRDQHFPGPTRYLPGPDPESSETARHHVELATTVPSRCAGAPHRWFARTVHRPTDDVAVLRVAGTLDSHTVPLVEATVSDELRSPTRILVMDLRDVAFFGGSGLRCLIRASTDAHRASASLRVVCHHRPVGRSLALLGLADILDLYPDLELALGAPAGSMDSMVPTCPARLNVLTRTQSPGAGEAGPPSNHVHLAVLRYLEAVADALTRRRVAVAGVETVTASEGLFGGRLGLGRNRVGARRTSEVVELRWTEITGWEVALRPHRHRPRTPWRFLADELTPSPHQVSAFVHALLRGADVGACEPAQFRSSDDCLHTLVSQLNAATAQPEPAYLQRVGYPPR